MSEYAARGQKMPSVDGHLLKWPPLHRGVLIRRYKRFLADVRLDDETTVTAHCANSGRMTACCQPGRPVWLSTSDNPRRKLAYTWQMIQMESSLVGVNTQIPNRLAAAAISAGHIEPLTGYTAVRREVPVGRGSRLDLQLSAPQRRDCFVEVKNCTLVENRTAMFPDAQTARGRRHLVELQRIIAEGKRCVMFFLIQRMDADRFVPADDIDPVYGRQLRLAAAAGVELLAYDVRIDLTGIGIGRRLPCRL